MLRLPRLHQGAPGAPEASGTARNLLQYLERALGGARIAVRQPDVGIDYADQRQQREIMALGDKLRADDDVASAFGDGVELLALSDHDTVSGVSEAIAAGERLGVRVVPAVEISAVDADAAVRRELHILGYRIDHTDPLLTERLALFLADREQRTLRMAAALGELGLELDERELDARRAAGQPIGRPHLAEAVLACPANSPRLAAEGIDDIGSMIRGYLVEGRAAFRMRETPTIAEAVDAIHDAGGLAVWAHPFWDVKDPAEVLATIDRFRADGLDGVEAYYGAYDPRERAKIAVNVAEDQDLHGDFAGGAGADCSGAMRFCSMPFVSQPCSITLPALSKTTRYVNGCGPRRRPS